MGYEDFLHPIEVVVDLFQTVVPHNELPLMVRYPDLLSTENDLFEIQ
jgi:hypothetical protein